MNGVTDFFNIFFGSTQSQITAYAILAAIIAICITILLTKTDMNIGDKLLLIFFILLTLIPGIFLILFEITCMVTGGNKDTRWWCWLYAWVVAVFVIIYCILVVIISFSSLFTYNNAMENIEMNENKNKMTPEDSNDYAVAIIKSNEHKETFENNNLQQTLNSLLQSADKDEKDTDEGFLSNSTEMINAIPYGKEMIKPKQEQISPFANLTNNHHQQHISPFTNSTHIQEQEQEQEQISPFTNLTNNHHQQLISPFTNSTHIQEQEQEQISPFTNLTNNHHQQQLSPFTNLTNDNSQKQKQEISSFYGGNYATIETFANKKKTEEKPKESKEKTKESSSKAGFKGSVSIDEEENENDTKVKDEDESKKDEEIEDPEIVVEPFGNMNFGMRYSKY
jgi:hypothetical protein